LTIFELDFLRKNEIETIRKMDDIFVCTIEKKIDDFFLIKEIDLSEL
jgi:hypothetical protein